jgi:GT2 family glycosyltransferase
MARNQSVVVIGVNYGTDDMALRFVRDLSRISKTEDVVIVLVDNTERSDSSELFSGVLSENPDAMCVKPPSNLGYFGGASFGLREYLRTGQDFDWLIVSNVDIEFSDGDFFTHLRDVDDIENVGVVAPSIWSNISRRDLNPRMVVRPSKKRIKFYKLLYRNFLVTRLYVLLSKAKYALNYVLRYRLLAAVNVRLAPLHFRRKSTENAHTEDSLKRIYAPQGSCIIFSKLYFLRGGDLNYPSFLFGEEIYVAETVRSIGLRTVYAPQLKVHHDDHVSTNEYRSREMVSYLHEAAVFIADTYFD